MRNAGGYLIMDRAGKTVERDTFTCAHCNSVVFVQPRADPATMGGFCRSCMKLICPKCAGKPCAPFQKQIEAAERRDLDRRRMDEALKR